MFRRALTMYLALLMVAAPCLCCCTTGRVLAAKLAKPVEAPPACCCHESVPDSPPTPIPAPPDQQERCPCRDHVEKPIQAQNAADFNLVDVAHHDITLDVFVIVPPVLGPSFGVGRIASLFRGPYPSAADLRDLHHRLRC